MTDLLTDALPTEWEGRAIRWDFRPMVWTLNRARRAKTEEDSARMICGALERFFVDPVPLEEFPAAFDSLVRFCQGAADEADSGEQRDAGSGELLLDYHWDADYILGAFQQVYGIDLTTETVHWWRFKALLRALPPEVPLREIMIARGADLSEMDASSRKHYEAMKERFALPPELKGVKRFETLQEHETSFLGRF